MDMAIHEQFVLSECSTGVLYTHAIGLIGVSSEGHAVMSVKVRPEPKDSGSEAREALWRESKTAEPSDNILERSMREASGCNVQ